MTKTVLLSSIKRCFLELKGVDDYYIKWHVEDSKLSFSAYVIAFGSSTVCQLSLPGVDLANLNVIIRNPKTFLNLLNIAEEELQLKFNKKHEYKLQIKDASFEQDYILCDPTVINVQTPIIDEPLSYDMMIELTTDFVNKYLKAKKANGSEVVSVSIKDRKATFELGDKYSNKSRFFIEEDGMFDMKKISFSSDVIEEIFQRNKDCTGRMFIHSDGLMKIYFKETIGLFTPEVTYFLIALDKL